MGFFSWECAASGRSISNAWSPRGAEPCALVTPDGLVEELRYDGYGVFGGIDVYAWAAYANGLTTGIGSLDDLRAADQDALRGLGIDIACYDEDNAALAFPIKIVVLSEYDGESYADLPASKSCPAQGYFYYGEGEV